MHQEPEFARTIDLLVEQVWNEVLGHGLRERGQGAPHASCAGDSRQVVIGIEGDWNGEMHLHCPFATALELAASFFRRPVSQITEQEIDATLLEVANILGGNLKSSLKGTNRLRLPRVVRHVGASGRLVHEQSVSLGGWPLRLQLVERAS